MLRDTARVPICLVMDTLRDTIRDRLQAMVGTGGEGGIDLTRPPGDDGLFGPRSAAWAVHGDFPAMMVGGVASLLMQMLHPQALAGIWDHSDWRRDTAGRLKRTAQFIAVTTYGATATAETLIARIRRIHDRVAGQTADGTPYSANDPALLEWVHVCEAWCFLAAYRRYRDPDFPAARQEGYHREMAGLALRMGAGAVPGTRAGVEAYFRAMRPSLVADARVAEVRAALVGQESRAPGMMAAQTALMQAGIELLPPWAARMHGVEPSTLARPAIRMGARGTGAVLRWALAPRRAVSV